MLSYKKCSKLISNNFCQKGNFHCSYDTLYKINKSIFFLLENIGFQLDIYFLEATITSNVWVYSFQGNSKLYAKSTNAIFGD